MSVMSLRQLARTIGVSDTAVRKAERAGVFGDAVRRDAAGEPGVVDVGAAIAAWERSGRQLRGSRTDRPETASAPRAAAPGPVAADVPIDARGGAEDDVLPDLGLDEDGVTTPSSPSLIEAQRLFMLEKHRRAKLDNDERQGLLLPVDRVAREAFEFARILRESVMNLPGRIGAQLAAETDPGRVYALLEDALREALDATANVLEAVTAATPSPSETAAS